MAKTPKEPKDLGLKVGSKKEQFLTRCKTAIEEQIEDARMSIHYNELILPAVEAAIELEKEKFK